MFCFHKKKKNTEKIFVILGIIIGAAAAAVGAYFLFTKVLKDKLGKKKVCEAEACEEIADETCEACEEIAEAVEEVVEEVVEAVEE